MRLSIRRGTGRERGQVLVLFALGLVAMLAAVGLVLDGGSTFAQRRSQQNTADLAALAGANAYLQNWSNVGSATAAAQSAARTVATQNGYTDGVDGATVTVTITTTDGPHITVDVGKPHANTFVRVVGMNSWQVSTSATALTGIPDTGEGAAPFIFSEEAFDRPTGEPLAQYKDKDHPYAFGDGNGDVPNNAGDIAWTTYGLYANLNTSTVRAMIDGSAPVNVTLDPTVDFNTYIGQHNNGNHTALYGTVQDYLAGKNVPVPIVNDAGFFRGWAMFHVVSAEGGSSKTITGYFVSPWNATDALTVKDCAGGATCPVYFGAYVLKLVN